jgi:Calx-beta domain
VSVDYATADDTAMTGSDYVGVSSTLNFADGDTTENITIQIINDSIQEFPEDFTVALSNPQGASLSTVTFPPATATVDIADDDVTAPPPGTVLLNEVSVNPPGTDAPNEYAEIEGTPNSVLNGIYFISIEGDPGSSQGNATQVFNLTGVPVGSNGLILIRGHTALGEDGATSIVASSIFDANGAGLQNNSNGFLVVYSPSKITAGTDLDTNNDGTLDLPSGAVVLDGIGWTDGGAGFPYGTQLTLAPATGNAPQGASRYLGNTNPNSASAWYFGELGAATSQNPSPAFPYNTAFASSNLPANAALTPGLPNLAAPAIAPAITNSVFDYNTSQQKITLTFNVDVSASFDTSDITLTQLLAPGSTVPTGPTGNIIVTPGAGNTIVLTFQNYPSNALPDGRYQLVVHAAGVTANGTPMASDFTMPTFFTMAADADRNGTVNSLDLNAVATNFGKSGTFSQGDFNYSGTVDIVDFNLLAGSFGKMLPASAPPVPLGSLFSADQIKSTSDLADLLASE